MCWETRLRERKSVRYDVRRSKEDGTGRKACGEACECRGQLRRDLLRGRRQLVEYSCWVKTGRKLRLACAGGLAGNRADRRRRETGVDGRETVPLLVRGGLNMSWVQTSECEIYSGGRVKPAERTVGRESD